MDNYSLSDLAAVTKDADGWGGGTAEFYADMAKAFLFDRDAGGPRVKMAAYYHGIAEHGK